MKYAFRTLATLLVASGIGGLAYAQPGPSGPGVMCCDGMGPDMASQRSGMKFDPAQRAERHLIQLKTQLKITAEQEPLWQAFTEKSKASHGGMHAMRTQMANAQQTAPERMKQMESAMESHLNAMKATHESFDRLYAALTPEQKKVADEFAAKLGQGGRDGKQMRPGRSMPPAQPQTPRQPQG